MSPQDVDNARLLWQLVQVGGTVVALITALIAVRRRPPLSEELYKDFATKADLDDLRSDFNRDLAALKTDLATYKAEINVALGAGTKMFHDMERTLGRVEGLLERCPYLCGSKGASNARP